MNPASKLIRTTTIKIFLFFFLSVLFCPQMSAQAPEPLKAKKAPPFIRKNVKRLAAFLTKDETTEEQKIKQITLWITHNIKYDVKHYVKYRDKVYSAKRILKRRKAVCLGYCDLFTALCREAKLNALTVPGYSKGGDYDYGDVFFKPDHSWNLVKIDNEWKPMDLTWASGSIERKRSLKMMVRKILRKPNIKDKLKFKRNVSDFWLTRTPKEFYFTHCASDPTYLLLNKTSDVSLFENLFTNALNLSPLSHDSARKYYVDNYENATITTKPDDRVLLTEIPKEYAEGGPSNEYNLRNNEEISTSEYRMADSCYNMTDFSIRDSIYLTKSIKTAIAHDTIALMHFGCRLDDIKTEKYLQDWKNKNKLDITKDEFNFLVKKTKAEFRAGSKTRQKVTKLKLSMKSLMKKIKNAERQIKKEETALATVNPKNKKHPADLIKTQMDSANSLQKQYHALKKIISRNDSVAHKLKDEMFKHAASDHLLRDKISEIVSKAGADRIEFSDSYDEGIMLPKKRSLILKTIEDSIILQQWLVKEDSVLKIKETEQKLFSLIQKKHKDRRKILKQLWKDTDDGKYHEMLNADFESTDSLLLWQANFCAAHKLYGRAKKKTYKTLLKALKKELVLFNYEMAVEKMRFSIVKGEIRYKRSLDKQRTNRKIKAAKKLLVRANKELRNAGKKK